ncbi:hypothetical protein TSUD_229490 [Trifolium subterraneum]|uniref:DYW domain-containing protein n=1 Tax=Trifolium subterraneum TaxID=3900 RepID=A0A2Z6ML75_TRISU|nr:hypothetical protein TSUD_229490 [Trifolium subterraneum]
MNMILVGGNNFTTLMLKLKSKKLMHHAFPKFCILQNLYTSIAQPETQTIARNVNTQIHNLSLQGKLEEAISLAYTNPSLSLQDYAFLFHACAQKKYFQQGMALHHYILEKHPTIQNDLFLTNNLLNMYCKCGHVDYARYLFDQMPRRNFVSWTVLISGYAQFGLIRECFALFSGMLAWFRPNEFAFASVLSACEECDIKYGLQVHAVACKLSLDFNVFVGNALITMYSKCCGGFGGEVEVATALVKSYANLGGHISDCYRLFLDTSGQHDIVSWTAIISVFAERDPEQAFLLFCQLHRNFFVLDRFIEAGLMRKEMRDSKVRKRPGLSWVEVGKQVHEFTSGGQRHPQRESILSRLETLIGQLKEIGYAPEISSALHDIEVEHIEDQLFHHSEKMALVFAIMNEASLPGGGNVIKIMKNIRICVDCHNFIKLASKLFQKEIVVRDSNRFHHFKYATCSCNDYW